MLSLGSIDVADEQDEVRRCIYFALIFNFLKHVYDYVAWRAERICEVASEWNDYVVL